jgi:methionyl-tRNA formyltransferase
MKLVFCGTPQFAVPTLNALVRAGHTLELVVTQPDRPSGRGRNVSLSAVKQRANELGLPISQPETLKANLEFKQRIESLRPDAIVVVAYGRIIPRSMLAVPRFGNLNVHASLLPKYRGAAPIQWAIAKGEKQTGITIIRLDEGLDTGPILLQRELAIESDDTALTLAPRLAELGAALMIEALPGIEAGTLEPVPQDHSRSSLAPLLKKEDGRIDFGRTAEDIHNRLRGFQPWPGTYTRFRGKHLEITNAQAVAGSPSGRAGTLTLQGERLFVNCGAGTALEIFELQPEGKRQMSAREFIHGYHPQSGESLG